MHISALEKQNQNVQSWDMILVYIITQKLDKDSRRAWEASIDSTKLPTWNQLHQFLQNRCRVLESVENNKNQIIPPIVPTIKIAQKSFVTETSTSDVCRLCNERHFIAYCQHFLEFYSARTIFRSKKSRIMFKLSSSRPWSYQ